ncbi:YdbH domain-containing protein [Shewanella jiangmenensis]|uniref:YdbH domain-containing protein n=1 Tax=Shewanella jiangmenensis TaxID=2837387 RepID=UPI001BDF06E7|nr:YdbH domain-containing protein [Shewanella jiangmenensis]
MAKRALRLFGIVTCILLLVIASGAAFLWFQGKDYVLSLARTELAKSGVTLNSLAWKLEPQGITLENLNLDIEDSRLQLQGLRVTFDQRLSTLALDAAKGYFSGELSVPMPQSIALDQSYVFLGSRSLQAASSQQASDRAALALNMDKLPLIALGPVMIDTAAGKLLKLDYLSLTSARELHGRIATPSDDKVLELDATLGKSRWQSSLELSLPGAHKLLQHLANSKLPIDDANPLALFLKTQRELDSWLAPVPDGDIRVQSSLELTTGAFDANFSSHGLSLSLTALEPLKLSKALKLDVADTRLNAHVVDGVTTLNLGSLTLSTRLDGAERRALASLASSAYVPEGAAAATNDVMLWLESLENALLGANLSKNKPADTPLSLEFALPQGAKFSRDSNQGFTLDADAVVMNAALGDWQWQVAGTGKLLQGESPGSGLHGSELAGLEWQSPVKMSLRHLGELDLNHLVASLPVPAAALLGKNAGSTAITLAKPELSLDGKFSLHKDDAETRLTVEGTEAWLRFASASASAASLQQLQLGQTELKLGGALSLNRTDANKSSATNSITKSTSEQSEAAEATPAESLKAESLAVESVAKKALTELALADLKLGINIKDIRLSHKSSSPERQLNLELGSANWQLRQTAPQHQTPLILSFPDTAAEANPSAQSLIAKLMHQHPALSATLEIERVKASMQAPRSDTNKRRKTTTLQLDSLVLNHILSLTPGTLNSNGALSSNDTVNSSEQWRIGRYQPLILTSQHKLSLNERGAPLSLTASWQGDNSLGDWREAVANIAGYAPDVRLAGDTHLSANISLNFPASTTDIGVNARFEELSGTLGDYPFNGAGLNASCSLHQDKRQSVNFFLGCKDVNWKLDRFAPGIVLEHIQGQGSLELESADDGTLSEFDISLTSQGELLKGKFFLPYFKLNQNQPSHAYLVLTGLSLEELLELQPVEGIQASGIFDGVLPVDVKQRKVSVSGGRLAARAPGGLIQVANNPAIDELVSSQPHLALVFDALKHLEYSSLAGDFNMLETGDATVDIEVKGKSEGIERPIHLNYSHQENLWQLIRSLTVADKLQNQIEQNIN